MVRTSAENPCVGGSIPPRATTLFIASPARAHIFSRSHIMAWLYLIVAILAEVAGTIALKYSEGFSKPLPLLVVAVGYGLAFFLLAKVVQVLPLAITYAIWAGVGIALVAVIGWLAFDQKLDTAAILGIGLIVLGVMVINGFSKSL
jgi:small multidrug resistance pump